MNMIAELVFIVSAILIILGAFFDLFAGNPSLPVLSALGFFLSIFLWAYFQDA